MPRTQRWAALAVIIFVTGSALAWLRPFPNPSRLHRPVSEADPPDAAQELNVGEQRTSTPDSRPLKAQPAAAQADEAELQAPSEPPLPDGRGSDGGPDGGDSDVPVPPFDDDEDLFPELVDTGLRVRVASEQGVFLVYDTIHPSAGPRFEMAYLCYWTDISTELVWIYGRLVYTRSEIGAALMALEEDLGIDAFTLAAKDAGLASGIAEAGSGVGSAALWLPATSRRMARLMGVEEALDLVIETVDAGSGSGDSVDGASGGGGSSGDAPERGLPAGGVGESDANRWHPDDPQEWWWAPVSTAVLVAETASWVVPGSFNPTGSFDNLQKTTGQILGLCVPVRNDSECCISPDPCCDCDSCCNGACCSCCGGSSCCRSGNCCGGQCCAGGQCCSGYPFAPCCPSATPKCCGSFCCLGTQSCGVDQCCQPGQTDCGTCCGGPAGSHCCGTSHCCPGGQACTITGCCDPVPPGQPPQAPCPNEDRCCPDGYDCCGVNSCCEPGWTCCGVNCCKDACEGCLDHGFLSGGGATVDDDPVCPGESLVFRAGEVSDSGGIKWIECTAKQYIPPAPIIIEWMVVKPDGTLVSGTGGVATVPADQVGPYICSFTADVERECPPEPISLGTAYGSALDCDDDQECTLDTCLLGECSYSASPGGEPCEDDGNVCTDDICQGGVCVHLPSSARGGTCENGGVCCAGVCCPPGQGCCGMTTCCDMQFCCDNGTCCEEACESCLDNGQLTGGTVQIESEVACVESVLIFTAAGVTDAGGRRRVNCTAEEDIPTATPTFTWEITGPDGTTLTGAGPVATIWAQDPGTYTCDFTALVTRDCAPPSLDLATATARVVKIRPLSVTFGGPDYRVVVRDEGSGPYPEPHWQDNSNPRDDDNIDVGDHHIPVVYPRTTRMHLTAEFGIEPAGGLGVVTINTITAREGTGAGPPQYRFSGAPGGGGSSVSNIPADGLLVDQVAYYNPLTLSWEFELSNGETLTCISPTNHRIYVTLNPPNPAITLFETVVHIGCVGAFGESLAADAVAAIWPEFTDLVVQRKPISGYNYPDGYSMTYYLNWDCTNTTVERLLQFGDGQCGAWAKLFIETLSAQGIEHSTEYVLFRPDPVLVSGADGFLVTDWDFATGAGLSGDPAFPYLNFVPLGTDFIGAGGFQWTFAEVSDLAGIPGQTNPNPNSLFGNHQVIKFGVPPIYYDPSYGRTFGSLAEIDATALSGFIKASLSRAVSEGAINFDINGDGDMLDTILVDAILVKKNAVGNQLKETLYEWPP